MVTWFLRVRNRMVMMSVLVILGFFYCAFNALPPYDTNETLHRDLTESGYPNFDNLFLLGGIVYMLYYFHKPWIGTGPEVSDTLREGLEDWNDPSDQFFCCFPTFLCFTNN